MSEKLCKDCKWMGPAERCRHPSNRDNVTGAPRYGCAAYRMFGLLTALMIGNCGKIARYFEPKENGA